MSYSKEFYEEILNHRDELIWNQRETIDRLRDSLCKYESVWWVKVHKFIDKWFK